MDIFDDEVLAAITAAVAMLDTRPGYNLVVRSYRRVNQSSPIWSVVGRDQLINSRL